MFVLACPTLPTESQAVQECCLNSSAIDFAVKTFDCLVEKLEGMVAK